jgi:hypothetical protein
MTWDLESRCLHALPKSKLETGSGVISVLVSVYRSLFNVLISTLYNFRRKKHGMTVLGIR